jgi:putative transposase
MKDAGIQGRYNHCKKPLMTDSRHGHRISKNKLKEAPFPTGPQQVVVTDTTYVWTDQGWHYLATVMDLFSREIIGWAFSATMIVTWSVRRSGMLPANSAAKKRSSITATGQYLLQ